MGLFLLVYIYALGGATMAARMMSNRLPKTHPIHTLLGLLLLTEYRIYDGRIYEEASVDAKD
jgi:hypothetical protein